MSNSDLLERRFVGLPEVAERLGVHRATVNDMVRAGRLRAHRVGACWQVEVDDLEAFAKGYVRPSNAPNRRERALPASTGKIIALLGEFGSADAIEVSVLVGLHEGTVRKHLRLMERAGLVFPLPTGQWELATNAQRSKAVSLAPSY
jgi:excisionase family DNA binding protein